MNLLSKRKATKNTLMPLCLASLLLVGCGSSGDKRPEYLDADTLKRLEVPPTLTAPNTRAALQLPKPSSKAAIKAKAKEKAKEKATPAEAKGAAVQRDAQAVTKGAAQADQALIAPVIKGFELKHDSRLYWLEIDRSVADVWASLPGFLASEGIDVDRAEKQLGFIDTRWLDEYKVTFDGDGGGRWFGSFSPDYKDRFRIRVEAGVDINTSRLYVSHRGLQISVANDVSEWVQRDSEPFLEREILYRFALFNGIIQSQSKALLAGFNSYQPRVNRRDAGADVIQVKGAPDIIWLRLQIAMDRLGVDVVTADASAHTLQVKVGNLVVEHAPETNSSGWFGGLFSGKDIQVDDEDDGVEESTFEAQPTPVADKDRVTLQLTQVRGELSSEIKIQDAQGQRTSSELALIFKEALFKQLK